MGTLDVGGPRWLDLAALGLRLVLAAVTSGIVGSGCGDGNGPDTRVYAFGRTVDGTACPAGTSEAYRDGALIVCDSCDTNADCTLSLQQCSSHCGPGCENGAAGCCAVRECLPIPCCPVCGDGVCDGDEISCNCASDGCPNDLCTAQLPTCGDGHCDRGASPGESHERCAVDCPLECVPCIRASS